MGGLGRVNVVNMKFGKFDEYVLPEKHFRAHDNFQYRSLFFNALSKRDVLETTYWVLCWYMIKA